MCKFQDCKNLERKDLEPIGGNALLKEEDIE